MPTSQTLLLCREDLSAIDGEIRTMLAEHDADQPRPDLPSALVGRRPGKEIDRRLTADLLVVGDDADLAAVVLRLLRTERLAECVVGWVPLEAGPAATRFGLPIGAAAVATAEVGTVRERVLVRDDAGGVLLGRGTLSPVAGPVYVDNDRLARVPTPELVVEPDEAGGVRVTAREARFLGMGHRRTTLTGRATQVAGAGMQVVKDGVPYPRPMDRWTWYRHTAPLRIRSLDA